MENSKERVVAYSVAQYLQGLKEKNGDSPQMEALEAACHSLESMFGFSLNDSQSFRELSFYPADLIDLVEAGKEKLGAEAYEARLQKLNSNPKFPAFVETVAKRGYFDGAEEGSVEYMKRHAKVAAKFQSKMETKPQVGKEDDSNKSNREQLAEEKKAAGNAAIAKKNYEEAVALYSEALALSATGPNSHIYYSNRAAAYCHLNNYQQAASDCERSVALNSTYVKAYSRLGLARFFLNQYQESIAAYDRAVELEPSNKSHTDALKQAKQKLEEQNKRVAASSAPSPGAGGMPDLASLAGLMGGAGGGGLASMLQNPQMMQMAQQMMQNPQMMQQAMAMLGGAGGGTGGGMPDMSALASMFGGAGGGASGSGGSGGGMPSFSGLVDENNR
jgi:small glutamine-rich tetratricopeptide repeat-containing protein alpha